jgi:biopolymer transport protein ExbD
MKFKAHSKHSQMLEINLVPMMDVLMTILTFFIILSMTYTSQLSVKVTLPTADKGVSQEKTPDPLVVGLNQGGEILLEDKPANEEQLIAKMQVYLAKSPQGAIVLKADRKLAYEKVVQLLGRMRDIGGDRVSLAIDK